MAVASQFGSLSHDDIYKVGAVVVRDGQILAQGWNGMVAGMPNPTRDSRNYTRPEVVHAEANAIAKLAKSGGGSAGATIYTTHSPCYVCSLLLLQAGIVRVVYKHVYEEEAIEFLKERGLRVECITGSDRLSAEESRTCECKQSESKLRRGTLKAER